MFMKVLQTTVVPPVAGQKSYCFWNKQEELPDFPHSGCPVTAVRPELLEQGDAIICEDQQLALKFCNPQGKC